eukprot:GILJ01009924.1.p1 GENE.GILJ01009924.1~~GILJ01009924.1.p1  ORF type:complete len:416 (+),score=60.02 GILJ01009924.1:25-1272(+)
MDQQAALSINSLSVRDLQAHLRALGKPVSGNKAILVDRLIRALSDAPASSASSASYASSASSESHNPKSRPEYSAVKQGVNDPSIRSRKRCRESLMDRSAVKSCPSSTSFEGLINAECLACGEMFFASFQRSDAEFCDACIRLFSSDTNSSTSCRSGEVVAQNPNLGEQSSVAVAVKSEYAVQIDTTKVSRPCLDQLLAMGFEKEVAVNALLVTKDDVEAAIVIAVKSIEDRSLCADMNAASILSENDKNVQSTRREQEETERFVNGDHQALGAFASVLFAQSSTALLALYHLSADIPQARVQMLQLLRLEKKAIAWYGETAKKYFGSLSSSVTELLSASGAAHMSSEDVHRFNSWMDQQLQVLTSALYSMPTIPGGLPDLFVPYHTVSAINDEDIEIVQPQSDKQQQPVLCVDD